MNNQNLIPTTQRSEKEARELGRKGGIASGKARRLKKQGRELMQEMLAMRETDPQIVERLAAAWGISPKALTKEIAANAVQVDKAIKKEDTAAFRAVHDLAGHFDEKADAQAHVTINISQLAADAGKKWSTQE